MRSGLIIAGIAMCIGLWLVWFSGVDEGVKTAALSEEARLAIDVRCDEQQGRAERECRSMLTRLYLSGRLDPDKTLRAYCETFKTARWGGSRPAPPRLCVERYGGWQEG